MSFRSDRRSSGDGRPYGGGNSSGESRSYGGGRPGAGRSGGGRSADGRFGGGRPGGPRSGGGGRPFRGGRPDQDRRFDRDGAPGGKSRFSRDDRAERGSEQGGRGRFDRFDRKSSAGRSGRFEGKGRFEAKGRYESKGRFDGQDRFERRDRSEERGERFGGDRFERSGSRFGGRSDRGGSSRPERSRPGRHDFRGGSRRGGWNRDEARPAFESDQRQGEELSHTPDAQADDMLWGRHATQAALEAGRPIHRIWCTSELRSSPKFLQLLREAKSSGVLVEEVTWARLGQLTGGAVHQGIALQTASADTLDLPTLVEGCAALGEPPLLLALDGLTDPHNLGAIVRSAEALGAHGVVLPQRRSAGLTGSVAKVAAGALEHLPVARVVNLNRSLETLKDAGYRVVGLAGEGDVTLAEADLEGPLAIVTGSEGQGLSLLTRRHCDQLIRIPLRGVTPSLNASVATAMCLYEVARRGWMKDLKGQAPSPPIVRPRCPSQVSEPSGVPTESADAAPQVDDALMDQPVAEEVALVLDRQESNEPAMAPPHFQDSVDL